MKPADPNAADSTDAALIPRIAGGDEEAFVELYRRRHPDVFRFAFAMSRSAAIAQDVAQDVFVELLEDASHFDAAKGSVRAWLFGSARHAVLDRLRRDSRLSDEIPDEAAIPCDGEDSVLRQQRLDKLHAAIVDLPFDYREVIVLCELQELSYADCATVLSCPIGTVRSRLHRAKALLAIRLGDLRLTVEAAANPAPMSAAPAAAVPAPALLKTSEVCT
jgi:RNA polymerase sigma-70 factor (ECF subfamily)